MKNKKNSTKKWFKELQNKICNTIESLEKDMLKILQNKPYKHAYAD